MTDDERLDRLYEQAGRWSSLQTILGVIMVVLTIVLAFVLLNEGPESLIWPIAVPMALFGAGSLFAFGVAHGKTERYFYLRKDAYGESPLTDEENHRD